MKYTTIIHFILIDKINILARYSSCLFYRQLLY